MKLSIKYAILIMTFFVHACVKDSGLEEETPQVDALIHVDDALKPYFERFVSEAKSRGVIIDLSKNPLTGVISDIATAQVIGQCAYHNDDPYKVTIDAPFWSKASDLGKEFVVFHELGHCVLGRDHTETADSRGFCTSIMRSGTGTCRDGYNATTRKVLIDELFQN